jgi:hypothetical protein
MFNEELNLVKKEFNRQSPSLTPFQPHYAGKATWARSLKKRIDTPMKVDLYRLLERLVFRFHVHTYQFFYNAGVE